jgi:hypothetical protein
MCADTPEPMPTSRCIVRLFARPTILCAWAALAIAVLHPPHETGLQLCWMHASTGVPCPGCGVIRSMASAAHGVAERSWDYHPFGIPLLLGFASIAIISVLPLGAREEIARHLSKRAAIVNVLTVALLAGFIAFGAARALHVLADHASAHQDHEPTNVSER